MKDSRPICRCKAYKFPHRVGGKCNGSAFAKAYFEFDRDLCSLCNCYDDNNQPTSCDVVDGRESIKEAECFRERIHHFPAENLPLKVEDFLPKEFSEEEQEDDF